jgi:hypothetical protein
MLQDFSSLVKIKSPITAVTCILVANFGFLASAFAFRDKFMIFEFYLSVCFIEVVMSALCDRLIQASLLMEASKQQQEQLSQVSTLLREQAALLGKYKAVLDKKE